MNKYSEERKRTQKEGTTPMWFTTGGYQLFVEKYLWAKDIKSQYMAIAACAAKHIKEIERKRAEDEFFNLMWNGWLSPSTPILANMGTDRGLPVSCSGGNIHDSIDGFYTARRETAILTKHGFGTSSYLGDIRARGIPYKGGKASGVIPVVKGFVRDMEEVAQASARRGAWAGYLPITHDDFDELCDLLHVSPDGLNIGWIVTDEFINGLNSGLSENLRRYQKALKTKMITGGGYFFFVDKANRHKPEGYPEIRASNLCTEIMLHSSDEYTFTCVLSSMNVAKYDEWKGTTAVMWATVFLDCVASEFIEKASLIPGMEKAVEFTKKGRALGLGVCGFHTLLQQKNVPFESLDAGYLNSEIFSRISREANNASTIMARHYGSPDWTNEGKRNTHLIAVAPTKSTALIMGGISEGINPDPAMAYTQTTTAGEIDRVNPVLLNLMKARNIYDKKHIKEIIDNFGSVQKVDWLTNEEKLVFKTAFEINQHSIIRMAAQRQKYIDQGQSINLFFAGDASPSYISEVHKAAFENEDILSLYYCYSNTGVQAAQENECIACQ